MRKNTMKIENHEHFYSSATYSRDGGQARGRCSRLRLDISKRENTGNPNVGVGMLLSFVCGEIKLFQDNLQAHKNGICNAKFGQFPAEPSVICS